MTMPKNTAPFMTEDAPAPTAAVLTEDEQKAKEAKAKADEAGTAIQGAGLEIARKTLNG